MTLNETQAAAVCQAFCAMQDLQDAALRTGIKCIILLDDNGALFMSPDCVTIPNTPCSSFLRNVKDRTPAEIDTFKASWIEALEKAKDAIKADRIAKLKAELAELEPFTE